jgi:hypothetical protein
MSEGPEVGSRPNGSDTQTPAGRANGTKGDKAGERGRWWTNPAITVPSILAVIGIVVSAFFALYPRSPQTVNHFAECQQAHPHAVGSAVASSKARLGTTTIIAGCLWPPITGTDSGGFWAAGVTVYPIAGAFAAEQYDYVEVFTTSCQALSLDYQFNNQLTVEHERFTVETSQTVSGYTGNPVNLLAGGGVPNAVEAASGTHLIVLFNGRYVLQHVECAPVP